MAYEDIGKHIPGAQPVHLEKEQQTHVQAWFLLGKKLDWINLESVVEYLEIKDLELLIDTLVILKSYSDNQTDGNS